MKKRLLISILLLAVAAAGGCLVWQARPYPEPAAPFVFRDGFEDAAKFEDLFPHDYSRWHGFQREAGARSNVVVLTAARVHTGTNALQCVAVPYDGHISSKADIERGRLRFVKGDHVWFSGWFYLIGGTDASLVFLWDLETTQLSKSPGRRLFLQQNGESLASDLGKWWTGKTFRQPRGKEVGFPKNRWVELRVHLFLSEGGDGKMEVWQDGAKVLDATGKTLPTARTIYDRLQVGITANGNRAHTNEMFMDDIVISNRPLE
ncbi:MAG: heparin lyase I family protein [Verrucomicrobia bacterium]|nr:heparin lyase I family protein [Verrucomicrobiota bacterium]